MATNFTTSGVHDGSERMTLAAWILFNTNLQSIYADHGCTTLTDHEVGVTSVNFSPGLGTNAYAPVSDCEANSKSAVNSWNDTNCQILVRAEGGGSYVDNNRVSLCVGGGGVS